MLKGNTINLSRDLDTYKSDMMFGFGVRGMISAILAVLVGGGWILLTYKSMSMIGAVYSSFLFIMPIGLMGFAKWNGLYIEQLIKMKLKAMHSPKELTYASTEVEADIENYRNMIEKEEAELSVTPADEAKKLLRKMIFGGVGLITVLIVLSIVLKMVLK